MSVCLFGMGSDSVLLRDIPCTGMLCALSLLLYLVDPPLLDRGLSSLLMPPFGADPSDETSFSPSGGSGQWSPTERKRLVFLLPDDADSVSPFFPSLCVADLPLRWTFPALLDAASPVTVPDFDEPPLLSLGLDSVDDSNGGQEGGLTGASGTSGTAGATVAFAIGATTGDSVGEETGAAVSGPAMGQNSSAGLPRSV